jgi:hypothetical protein
MGACRCQGYAPRPLAWMIPPEWRANCRPEICPNPVPTSGMRLGQHFCFCAEVVRPWCPNLPNRPNLPKTYAWENENPGGTGQIFFLTWKVLDPRWDSGRLGHFHLSH